MSPKELARQSLERIKVMQLATAEGNDPWLCTVHFYADEALNLYWVSRTDRKHSKQIAGNPKACATMVVHENTPEEEYVISVTLDGNAELVKDAQEKIREAYVAKLNKDASMLPSDDPKNLQKFYRLTPESIVLFDTKNFPQSPRQEFSP